MSEGYIKLNRKLLTWQWKDDPNMVALWIEILLQANYEESNYHGESIKKGEFLTSVEKLSKGSGLSTRQVRTCLERLKKTQELTIETTNKGTKICVVKWAQYQGECPKTDKRSDKRATSKRQASDNSIRKKERNNIERYIYKELATLWGMGLDKEYSMILGYCEKYSPSYEEFLKIKDAVFDPNIRHIDQYVETIMKGKKDE